METIFRTMKSQLDTRSIFTRPTRRSVATGSAASWRWCSRKALQDGLEAQGYATLESAHILDDLDRLQEIELTMPGKPYRLRTEAQGMISAVFSACGVAPLPTLQPG